MITTKNTKQTNQEFITDLNLKEHLFFFLLNLFDKLFLFCYNEIV